MRRNFHASVKKKAGAGRTPTIACTRDHRAGRIHQIRNMFPFHTLAWSWVYLTARQSDDCTGGVNFKKHTRGRRRMYVVCSPCDHGDAESNELSSRIGNSGNTPTASAVNVPHHHRQQGNNAPLGQPRQHYNSEGNKFKNDAKLDIVRRLCVVFLPCLVAYSRCRYRASNTTKEARCAIVARKEYLCGAACEQNHLERTLRGGTAGERDGRRVGTIHGFTFFLTSIWRAIALQSCIASSLLDISFLQGQRERDRESRRKKHLCDVE